MIHSNIGPPELCPIHGLQPRYKGQCVYCRLDELETAIAWVLNDASYKPPEQFTAGDMRWVWHLYQAMHPKKI